VPAGPVARRLETIVEGVDEDQHAAVVVGAQLPEQVVGPLALLGPGVTEEARRIPVGDLVLGHVVDVAVGVPADAPAGPRLEGGRGRVPGEHLFGVGQGLPDPLRWVGEDAFEAQRRAAVDFLQDGVLVGHC
jgi:hypothetical protein